MAKWSKKLLGLAAIGSAAAGLVYYFKKSKKWDEDDFNDDFEDEDFDLDNDLQPVDRGYVNLNASKETTEDADSEDADAQTDEKLALMSPLKLLRKMKKRQMPKA